MAAAKKKLGVNPKDSVGSTKVSLSKLPAIAHIHGAMAMMDGADKYGAYNWRESKVIASIYVDAAMRHLYCWLEGEETAADSRVHHLGHAIACAAILLDAQRTGNLVDDRPRASASGGMLPGLLDELSETIKAKRRPAHKR